MSIPKTHTPESNRFWPTEHPLRLSVVLFALLSTILGAVTYSDYEHAQRTLDLGFEQSLRDSAEFVVAHINPDNHSQVSGVPQTYDRHYQAVQKVLQQSVKKSFIDAFTIRFPESGPAIVVRANSPGSKPANGSREPSRFSPSLDFFKLHANVDLKYRFISSNEPFVVFPLKAQKLNRFFFVFAPLRTSQNELDGVVCLVRGTEDYDQRIASSHVRSVWSVVTGVILVGGIALLIWYTLYNRTMALRDVKKVMSALAESEQRMKFFIQHAPSAVAMFDNQMRYIAFSRRWLENYGIEINADITGFHHYDVVPNTPPQWRIIHSRCLTGARETIERDPVQLPNGKTQWSHWEILPWYRTDGQIGGLLMSTRDVTQEVEQEQLLKSQANRLDLAIHSADLATWDLDVQNEFMHFGGRGLTILGFDSSVKFLRTRRWYDKIHQDDVNQVDQAFHALLTSQSTELSVEYRIKRIDGTWAWLSSVGKVTEHDSEGVAVRAMGISMDISESKASELALQQATADVWRLATAIDSHSDAVLLTDRVGNILQVNRAYEEMTGFKRHEAIGKPLGILEHSRDHVHTYRSMWDTILSGKPWNGRQCNVRIRRSDQTKESYSDTLERFWTDVSVTALYSPEGQVEGYVSIQRDVSDEVAREEQLAISARTDELTGLGNRKYLNSRLERALELQSRIADYQFAVLFLDVDRFKLVNDSLGHQFGDMVLQEVAARLRRVLRCSDAVMINATTDEATAIRWGGDEFVVLLDHLELPEDTVKIAERILSELSQPFTADGHSVQCSASIGIVVSNTTYDRADEILRDADIALFEAKSRGKARWVIFDDSMQKAVERRLTLENELRSQQHFDQFHVVFQPIVDVYNGMLRGTEALVRWKHPRLGFISPLEFIQIAEECHVILDLGQWIMEQACQQWLAWHDTVPERAPEYITINISRVQLADANFLPRVAESLQKTGIPPERVVFEITESTVMKDPELMKVVLRRIKALGIRLAIDDFGTGHSSLSCLHEFPFDILKIDRSFVSSFSKSGQVIAMTQAIVTLARHIGMVCVAEGAETCAEVQVLRECGCELIQGYYFGRPMLGDQVISEQWHSTCLEVSKQADLSPNPPFLGIPLPDNLIVSSSIVDLGFVPN
jgi:diguanylate cyclase (GGDEF)-like protein/PAS domain S-box-containing protein